MGKKLATSIQYIKNILTTGAVGQTSREVELEICAHLPKGDNKIIVEYGMGLGNITMEVLNTISPTSKLYAFEVNKDFCEKARKTINDQRLIIINSGAETLLDYIQEPVDGFISSIPFSFFSKEVSAQIIQSSYDLLREGSYFSQVLLTKFNFKKFTKVFDECEMIRLGNIPVEFIYHCRKKKK
jgi:phospholipid N-methyltransferase